MIKKDITDRVYKKVNASTRDMEKQIGKRLRARNIIKKSDCNKIISALGEVIEDALVNDGEVTIRGFLKLKVNDMPAVNRRNPQTGIVEKYPAQKRIQCKISDSIRRTINDR